MPMVETINVIAEDATKPDLAQVDELIPRPTSGRKKLLVSVVLLVAVFAVSLSWETSYGYVYPNPNADRGGDVSLPQFVFDQELGLVGVRVGLENPGPRDLRLTDVNLDAPGAELVFIETLTTDRRDSDSSPFFARRDAVEALPPSEALPVAVPGRWNPSVTLRIWFRPTSCIDQPAPWGVINATFDFGEGAFPPISRVIAIENDPIWPAEDRLQAGSQLSYEGITADGPLELICKVMA